MLTTAQKVSRMLDYVFGDEYGDGTIVTNVISGYAEPGYGSVLSDETPVVLLGNWNPKRFPRISTPLGEFGMTRSMLPHEVTIALAVSERAELLQHDSEIEFWEEFYSLKD